MLLARLRAVDQTLQLKRHRSGEAGVCDLLNYAAVVADGVVIGKNGALIAGWEYTGDDHASVTDIERDMVSVRLNQALARLGNGWMLHVDAVRRSAEVYSARGQRSRRPANERMVQREQGFLAVCAGVESDGDDRHQLGVADFGEHVAGGLAGDHA
jgi:type IV secretion system protein VirB4